MTRHLQDAVFSDFALPSRMCVDAFSVDLGRLDASGSRSENTWKVMKCGVGGGWKRSVGPIM
jgi:hypothetical protein